MPFDSKTLASQNHLFGLRPTHYEPRYYLDKTKQLVDIINRDNQLSDSKELERRKVIESFSLPNLNKNGMDFEQKKELIREEVLRSLKKYNTARIDIKNHGSDSSKLNSIKINNASDDKLGIAYPKWFKNSKGQGAVIKSNSNFLSFDIECIGDGLLRIYLLGIDKKLHGKRIPIYIKYTNFLINGKKINDKELYVCHDNRYVYERRVQDKDKLSLYIEWLPI